MLFCEDEMHTANGKKKSNFFAKVFFSFLEILSDFSLIVGP